MHNVIKTDERKMDVLRYEFPDNLKQFYGTKKDGEGNGGAGNENGENSLDYAVTKSEELLSIAREEAERIREEARKQGYEFGVEQGMKAGYEDAFQEESNKLKADREQIKEEVKNIICDMQDKKQELLDKYLEDLKNIAIAVGEKVIRVSLKSSSETIKIMIISATNKLKKQEWARINISKYDAEMMVEGDAELLNALSYLSDNIKIVTMDHEKQGTCILELPDEIIDLSVDTQMDNIRDILNNV